MKNRTILRSTSPVLPYLKPVNASFYETSVVELDAEIKDSEGNIVGTRPIREAIRKEIKSIDLVSDLPSEMTSVEVMLETGQNSEVITKPYFRADRMQDMSFIDSRLNSIVSQIDVKKESSVAQSSSISTSDSPTIHEDIEK